jgi:hypothetical protein
MKSLVTFEDVKYRSSSFSCGRKMPAGVRLAVALKSWTVT